MIRSRVVVTAIASMAILSACGSATTSKVAATPTPSPTPDPQVLAESSYLQFVSGDVELTKGTNSNVLTVCVKPDKLACIGALQADLDAYQQFQHDLDGIAVPVRFIQANSELRTALALMVQADQEEINGLKTLNRDMVIGAVSVRNQGATHLAHAVTSLPSPSPSQ